MVGSNKILTVSYGTFSCTLEGFEDSFGTMKAIAEYFRDLAADDRYFGATPPVPDVEMLGRIAEREVARRVEARIDASGITLRTGNALAAAAFPTRADAPVGAAMPTVPEIPMAVATAAPSGHSVGPKADVIGDEASVLREAPELTIPADLTDPDPRTDVTPPKMPPAAVAPVAPVGPVRPILVTPTRMATAVFLPDVFLPDAPLPDAANLMPASLPDAANLMPPSRPVLPAHPDADSVAAKLQRIRAVVGRGLPQAAPQDYAEDSGDGPAPLASPWDLPVSALSFAAAFAAAAPADAVPAAGADPAFGTGPASDPQQSAAAEPEHSPADEPAGFDLAAITAALAAADTPAAPLADDASDPALILQDIATPGDDTLVAAAMPLAPAADVVAVAPPAPVRARVIRMRRAEADPAPLVLSAAIAMPDWPLTDPEGIAATGSFPSDHLLAGPKDEAFDDLDDLAALDGPAEPAPAADRGQTSGSLSADDEADLLEELAALEREAQSAAHLAADDADIARILSQAGVEDAGSLPDALAMPPQAETPPLPDDSAFDFAALAATLTVSFEIDATQDDAPHAPITEGQVDAAAEAATDAIPAATTDADPTANQPGDQPDAAVAILLTGRDLLGREPEADAAAMERILSQTDAELAAPDSSRRREAIAQLKAAVAATEAARRLGDLHDAQGSDEVENAFRDDLKQVVRPRRPVGEVKPDTSRERPRPAPLKLVASQRIDVPQPRPAAAPALPVRPRRVSVDPEALPPPPAVGPARPQVGSFAAFAESMGAKALPDLLEAAAAYTSFVEGVADFSRPQLMKRVQDIADQDFSREDGLRSFGTLLRQGRIVKTRNGRFQVNGESRFNPERRAG